MFTYLPGVGPKTAVRFVFYLLKQPKSTIQRMSKALQDLHDAVVTCSICKTYSTEPVCETCSDSQRDRTLICVVAQPRDVGTLDAAGFRGRYHVLGGTLSPIEGMTPEILEVESLVERLKTEPVREIILAFNPDIEGESTIMYLSKLFKTHPVRLTRLARGLPAGSDLEFADEVTLGDALNRRWELS
jgi:recombination protein RecR